MFFSSWDANGPPPSLFSMFVAQTTPATLHYQTTPAADVYASII